mmetsp:Transcript_8666/g.14695  ORF Transcript_8666/g.14695 Transcript_8666/m.14695 type:complete len:88 (-) Transcript_8666:32-295(-)
MFLYSAKKDPILDEGLVRESFDVLQRIKYLAQYVVENRQDVHEMTPNELLYLREFLRKHMPDVRPDRNKVKGEQRVKMGEELVPEVV